MVHSGGPVDRGDPARSDASAAPVTRGRFVLLAMSTAVAAWALIGAVVFVPTLATLRAGSAARDTQAFADFIPSFAVWAVVFLVGVALLMLLARRLKRG